jgi:hypothetical protein
MGLQMPNPANWCVAHLLVLIIEKISIVLFKLYLKMTAPTNYLKCLSESIHNKEKT